MQIAVDACCWANGRGYGRFTREILRTMVSVAPEDSFTFFLDPAAADTFDIQASNARRVTVQLRTPVTKAAVANGRRSLPDMLRLTRAVARCRPDVFFCPSVYSFFPLPPRLPALVTIHDVIVERFPRITMPSARARLFWRLKVRMAIRQARLVLTVSDYSAREICEVLNVPRSRIRLTSEAPSAVYQPSDSLPAIAEVARRVGLPQDAQWFMYVGGFNPHKRVDTLIRAHGALLAGLPGEGPYLLLVGNLEDDSFYNNVRELRCRIVEAGTAARVIWTGFLSDEEVRQLHSGALGLILPSESEGFGLPAVEAAACGIPVIATHSSPLPDLLEGGGIFVPPGDEERLRQAMWLLWDNVELRVAMGRRALERANSLSWETGARAALDALREVAQ